MPRYTIVKEVIGEYIYHIEAEDEEAAVLVVTLGLEEPDDFEVVSEDGHIVLVEIDE